MSILFGKFNISTLKFNVWQPITSNWKSIKNHLVYPGQIFFHIMKLSKLIKHFIECWTLFIKQVKGCDTCKLSKFASFIKFNNWMISEQVLMLNLSIVLSDSSILVFLHQIMISSWEPNICSQSNQSTISSNSGSQVKLWIVAACNY